MYLHSMNFTTVEDLNCDVWPLELNDMVNITKDLYA